MTARHLPGARYYDLPETLSLLAAVARRQRITTTDEDLEHFSRDLVDLPAACIDAAEKRLDADDFPRLGRIAVYAQEEMQARLRAGAGSIGTPPMIGEGEERRRIDAGPWRQAILGAAMMRPAGSIGAGALAAIAEKTIRSSKDLALVSTPAVRLVPQPDLPALSR